MQTHRLSILCLLGLLTLGMLAPNPAQAVGPVLNHCIFDWDEAVVPGNDLSQFNFYISSVTGGPYALFGTFLAPSPSGGASYSSPRMCSAQTTGQKFVVITAADFAGNESPMSAEIPFVLDVSAPPAVTNPRVR